MIDFKRQFRDYVLALEAERRLLWTRLAFAVAIAFLASWLGEGALAFAWAGATAALEILGAHCDDQDGYGPAGLGANIRRVGLFAIISCAWAAGPVLAYPHLRPDLQLVTTLVWIAALLMHSALYSYRSLLLFMVVMTTKVAALGLLVLWSAPFGADGALALRLAIAGVGAAFVVMVAIHRRNGDRTIEGVQQELKSALMRAEEANVAKSQFLASMSHELRTPLNAVIGYSELLREDLVDAELPDAVADLDRIRRAAHNLLGLINDVLDLAKIEAGKMDTVLEHVDVARLIHDAVELVTPVVAANENLIEVHIDPEVSTAWTDETKLRQCLLNLLSNAAKFTTGGRITVTVGRQVDDSRTNLVVSVADTGIGISPDALERLFFAFNQAESATSRRFGGTGLGLVITRKLAQLLGGDVAVKSVEGEGSVFTLTVRSGLTGRAAEGDQSGEGPLVLIIENEDDAVDLVRRAIGSLPFSTQSTPEGRAGLALARSARPTLILLDIELPDMQGWQVLEQLRADPNTADIPVVVVSIDNDRNRSLALGAREHLTKPCTSAQIASAVLRHGTRQAAAFEAADAPKPALAAAV